MEKSLYDVVIVGSGMAGLSTAYHALRRGDSVAIIDTYNGLKNASFDATAILSHDPDCNWELVQKEFGLAGAKDIWKLSQETFHWLSGFSRTCPKPFATRAIGSYLYAHTPEHVELAREQYELYKSIGATCFYQEGRGQIHPNFLATVSVPADGQTNNQAIIKNLLRVVAHKGGKMYRNQEVLEIAKESNRVGAVTQAGTVWGKRLIVASGNGKGLVPAIAKHVEDRRTVVIAYRTKDADAPFDSSVLWDFDHPYHYVRLFRGSVVWVGGTDVSDAQYDEKKLPQHIKALEAHAKNVLNFDSSYARDGEWVGRFFETKLGLPFVGPTEDERIWVNIGHGGTGILSSLSSGRLIADWMEGKSTQYQAYFSPHRRTL